MRRAIWIGVIAVLGMTVRPTAAAEPPRLNILFITSDDHRWDGLGAAGNPAIHTPELDRLAARGVYFRQATTHVSQCLPVRATLLTGLTVHQHGAYTHEDQRADVKRPEAFRDIPTLPGLLREAGYRTVLVGKWHLDADPWLSGFSEVRTWLPGGATLYKDPELARGNTRQTAEIKGYTQEILADDAIGFLRGPAGGKERKEPFFLWLAFTAPHVPLGPNPPAVEKLYADKPPAELMPPGFPRGIPTNDWRHYDEAVSDLDRQVGRVLAALGEAGLAESTVVVFLGDNGHMMGRRGMGAKGAAGKVVPYEDSIRVPLIVWSPRLKNLAGPSDLPASSLDLPPTLLRMAGVQPPAIWAGRDLAAALRKEPGAILEDAFSEWADEKSEAWGGFAFRSVRTPRHKLIVWRDAAKPDELYDLAADSGEEKNLIDQPESQEIRRDLAARLRVWMERTSDPALRWPKLLRRP
ncbi:MAG TPA: sulfatase-like hydrolase/transferase [Thermoanaerobaculia bacterium]|nr:sulfatase-like hydrolase/transferase [Thermoanaerobaculia bacterium]